MSIKITHPHYKVSKMIDINKIQLKIQLLLGLISPDDVQTWAMHTLENDPSSTLALEICYLSDDQDLLNYFEEMVLSHLIYSMSHQDRQNLTHPCLKQFADQSLKIRQTDTSIKQTFQMLLNLTQTIEDDDLYNFINYYDNEYYLANEAIWVEATPQQVFQNFLKELKNWGEAPPT